MWPIVAIALIGTPLTVVTNAAEFLITARVLGQRSRPAVAIRVALLSIAANLLPVPGSLLVRARALTSSGASYRDAASTSLMIGVAWLSMTSIVAGACLIALMPVVVGSSVILGGLAGFVWVARFVARRAEDVGKTVVLVAVVELMAVFAAALRFWLALRAMSVGAGIAQAVVLSSSGVLSSLAGVFPGGMGLRELLSGALGAAVDLPSARGVATSVVDRLVLVAMLSPVALGLARSRS